MLLFVTEAADPSSAGDETYVVATATVDRRKKSPSKFTLTYIDKPKAYQVDILTEIFSGKYVPVRLVVICLSVALASRGPPLMRLSGPCDDCQGFGRAMRRKEGSQGKEEEEAPEGRRPLTSL